MVFSTFRHRSRRRVHSSIQALSIGRVDQYNMSNEGENSMWISIGCSIAVLAAVSSSYKFIEPNRGQDLKIHAFYIGAAISCVIFLPTNIASYIFTDLTVALVASVYPVYRATKAVCTPEEVRTEEYEAIT